MQYVSCGNSGLKLSRISLGCWQNFGNKESRHTNTPAKDLAFSAFDAGITHFDLANNYGPPPGHAEILMGGLLKQLPRDELIVATKAGYPMWNGPFGQGGSKKHLTASLDQSLTRLNLPYVDIFYSHCPDPETPLEETLETLDALIKQGKTLYVGLSNYTFEDTTKALSLCQENGWTAPVVQQSKFHMLHTPTGKSLPGQCRDLGLGFVAFGVLAKGLLTGKYQHGAPAGSRMANSQQPLSTQDLTQDLQQKTVQLQNLATQRNQTPAQLTLSWSLYQYPISTALMGASTAQQIQENVKALNQLSFSKDEIQTLQNLFSDSQTPIKKAAMA